LPTGQQEKGKVLDPVLWLASTYKEKHLEDSRHHNFLPEFVCVHVAVMIHFLLVGAVKILKGYSLCSLMSFMTCILRRILLG
jgi:hypothetical protein